MSPERFTRFPKNEQMAAVGAEVMRARFWEGKDKEKFNWALERAMELVDLTLDDPRWKEQLAMLLYLRQELAKFYIGRSQNIASLYATL